jgi:hypothetical protein
MERDQYQDHRKPGQHSVRQHGAAEDRLTNSRGDRDGTCLDTKGQTVTICKEMVDYGLNTTPLYLHILEKSRPLGVTGRTNRITPRRDY